MSQLKVKKPSKIDELKAMSPKDRNRAIGDLLMNNAMFIIIAIAVVGIAIAEPTFLSIPSIVNIVCLTAAKLPIALGVGGCIILAGTDISAGRQVGLAAAISAGLQLTTNKLFPGLQVMPIPVALLAVNNPIGVVFAGIFMAMLNIVGQQLTGMTAYNEYITDVIIAVIVYLSAFSLVIRTFLTRKIKVGKVNANAEPEENDEDRKGGEQA